MCARRTSPTGARGCNLLCQGNRATLGSMKFIHQMITNIQTPNKFKHKGGHYTAYATEGARQSFEHTEGAVVFLPHSAGRTLKKPDYGTLGQRGKDFF